MNAQKITTHVEDAADRLLEQYKGRPNWRAFVAAFAEQVQALENALFDAVAANSLVSGSAVGAQLDVLGSLVGIARNGLTDAQYLAVLRGQIAQNNGNATTEDTLTVVRGLFLTLAVFLKTPNSAPREAQAGPATVSVSVGDPTVPAAALAVARENLRAALGAGVALNYLGRFRAAAGAFAFAGTQPYVRGFGSLTNSAAGGGFGGLLSNSPTL